MKPKLLVLTLLISGVLLVSVGVYLLDTKKSEMSLHVFDTRLGPVNITLGPGETQVFTYKWITTNSTPKVIAGSNYLVEETPSPPKPCKYIPLLHIQSLCYRKVLGVEPINISPPTSKDNQLLVKFGAKNCTAKPLVVGNWKYMAFNKPGEYHACIENTGNETIHVQVYYGLGVYKEERPYATCGVLLLITGSLLLAVSIAYYAGIRFGQ